MRNTKCRIQNLKSQIYNLKFTISKQGFTLLELLIVLTIIGIGSAIVGVALYRGLGDLKLKSTAKEVASALRYSRSQAVTEKQVYIFSLDPEKGVYYIFASPSPKSSPLVGEGEESKTISKTLPEGIISVSKERIDIFFYPLGNSTGGNLALVNEKGSTWAIEIEPSTGRVKIEKVKS